MNNKTAAMNELAFYTLAGAPRSPRDLIDEVGSAERQGIGACFISERFNIKEAATLSGAVGAVSERIGIATAATNHNTRHPLVTAAYATTMHFLTGGRFSLGLGRGIDRMFDSMGLAHVKTRDLEDFVQLMRRLWKGETVLGHDSSLGKFPALRLDPAFREHIPITFTAFGPNSLAFGGAFCDAVVLHTFLLMRPQLDASRLSRMLRGQQVVIQPQCVSGPVLQRSGITCRKRFAWHPVAHWPRKCGSRSEDRCHFHRCEVDRIHPRLMDDAPLVAIVLGLSGDALRHRQSHELARPVDMNIGNRIGQCAEEVTGQVRSHLGQFAAGDEEGGAENLRGSCRALAIGVIGREAGLCVNGCVEERERQRGNC